MLKTLSPVDNTTLQERVYRTLKEAILQGRFSPGETLPTRVLLSDPGLDPVTLAAALRRQRPAVVARIERDQLVLDLRTVLPEEDETLASVLRDAVEAVGVGRRLGDGVDGRCGS